MINQQPANHKPPSVLFLIFMAFLFLAFAIGMVFLAFTVFYPLFLHATSYSYNIIQGDQNFHQGRYEQAISNYSQALTLKPGSAYA